MDLTRVYDWLRNLERGFQELRSELARMPVERGKVKTGVVTVYEFRNCDNNDLVLYADNAEIAQHEPGEVAAIDRDGFIECWQLVGNAAQCKTGECILILGWGANCAACDACFALHPCSTGTFVFVRGVEWMEYLGRIVSLDAGAGLKCYTVEPAENCAGVDESITTDDIEEVYDSCDNCGCYELTHCDSAATQWILNDLAALAEVEDPLDLIGRVIEIQGVCWEITAYESPCTQVTAELINLYTGGDVIDGPPPKPPIFHETCEDCCYLLTPCEGQAGSPVPIKVIPYPNELDLRGFIQDDGTSNGKVLMLAADHICYTVSRPGASDPPDDCTGALSGLGTVEETYDSCGCCGITCWKQCGTSTYIRTYSDLCEYKRAGVALKRAEDGLCYEYESSPGTCGEPAIVDFTVEEVYEHATLACTICGTPKFKLTPACATSCTDCEGSDSGGSSGVVDVIVTDEISLLEAVGQYVKVDGHCYLVELTTDAVTDSDVCWMGPFSSCQACLAAPTRLTVIALINGVHKEVQLQGVFRICGIADATEDCGG